MHLVQHHGPVDHALGDVGTPGEVVHHFEQHLFEDGAETAGPRTPQQCLFGHRLEGVIGQFELDVIELEHPLVLAGERVLRLDQDADERLLVQVGHRARPPGGDR